jgi:hypothetical protein
LLRASLRAAERDRFAGDDAELRVPRTIEIVSMIHAIVCSSCKHPAREYRDRTNDRAISKA